MILALTAYKGREEEENKWCGNRGKKSGWDISGWQSRMWGKE